MVISYGSNRKLIQVLNSNIGSSSSAQFLNYLFQKL